MGRQEGIARSIVAAMTVDPPQRSALRKILAVGAIYGLPLSKVSAALFSRLRREYWAIKWEVYVRSFTPHPGEKPEDVLQAIGDMGFSGSTFFDTTNKRFLIKSVPRYFEHSFFRDDLLEPYVAHMQGHPRSLLVRICDFLAAPYYPIGSLLGIAPTHHIVMENILYGKESTDGSDDSVPASGSEWKHWDLKPLSYFLPERDIASGALVSEATMSRLADDFQDKMVLTQKQAEEFWAQLEEDTALLASCNAVDYSLFLIRITAPEVAETENPFADPVPEASAPAENTRSKAVEGKAEKIMPDTPPLAPPGPPTWRTGMPSPDGKHIWRAAVLDFFWAKHKAQPKLMTFLITAWNKVISRQGHMSITTTPNEYRERFLGLCREIVEIRELGEDGDTA